MFKSFLENTKIEVDDYITDKTSQDCEVSKASTEIMLDRFCNGNEIEFPF